MVSKQSSSSSSPSPNHCCTAFMSGFPLLTSCLYVGRRWMTLWSDASPCHVCVPDVAEALVQNASAASGHGYILLQSGKVRWQVACVKILCRERSMKHEAFSYGFRGFHIIWPWKTLSCVAQVLSIKMQSPVPVALRDDILSWSALLTV